MPALNKRFLQPGQRIAVLVVDDSVVIRRLVTHIAPTMPDLSTRVASAARAASFKRRRVDPGRAGMTRCQPSPDG